MDFALSEEQQLLKDSVDRFVRSCYQMDQRRKLIESDVGYSEDNWRQMAELGWLGVSFPEDFGGLGGSPVETMVLMEAFGEGLVVEPYFPTVVLGGTLVALAGTEAQKSEILPAVAEGGMKLAFAYVERQAGFDLFDIETSAKKNGSGFVLNGAKGVVYGAESADKIIVSARAAGGSRDKNGIGLFVVDPKASGVTLRGYRTIDGLRAAEVELKDVAVGADAALGDPEGAWAAIEAMEEHAIAALCAEAMGAMKVVVDSTNEYLKTREQFGRPIGKFQVLQHKLADMLIASEESRSITYHATLRLLEDDAKLRAKAVTGAKQLIGRHGRMIGQSAVQLHGGMGMTEEMAVGHYYKRLTMLDIMFGDYQHHLKRYAALAR